MLLLSRKPGEGVVIGDQVRVVVLRVRGNQVQLGLSAPHDIPIRREELQPRAELDALADRPCR